VFVPEPRGRPTVDQLAAEAVVPSGSTPSATRLTAEIDPHGADTHYYIEYGTASCATAPSACTRTNPAADIGEGFGDEEATLELPGLHPGLYYYRLTAENALGSVESAEQTFTVLATSSGLPDSRQWELVSPPEKNGAEPFAISKEGGVIQASESGEAISYLADGPMPATDEPEGSRNPEPTQVLSVRGREGWMSRDIITPSTAGTGVTAGTPPEYQLFSANLSLSVVEPFAGPRGSRSLATPPLSLPAKYQLEGNEVTESESEQENTIYLRDDNPLAPEELPAANCEASPTSARCDYERAEQEGARMQPTNPGYLALVTRANSPGHAEFDAGGFPPAQEGLAFDGATPDLSHVVFTSYKDAPGLYEWNGAGQPLQLVSMLPPPSNTPAIEPTLGLEGPGGNGASNAISDDGSRVFWSTRNPYHLYVFARDPETGTHETLQLDTVEGGTGEGSDRESPAFAQFQAASDDGTRVFFTDTERLTSDSKAVYGAPDLYVWESVIGDGPVSGKLTDLTPAEGADVLGNGKSHPGGGVLGTSADGSYVYFVANGAFAPGAKRGLCPEAFGARPEATCNLYVRHYNATKWEPAKLVAALSAEDQPDWDGEEAPDLIFKTSSVSPSGRYLAFMSDRSLAGYDNEDITSEKQGERLDEEVYLYDASKERLVCASCNPTGARPAGVQDSDTSGEEGLGLVADRPGVWAKPAVDHWLAGSVPGWTALTDKRAIYQSRYLSENGRLFFNSPDRLVPEATGEKEKVYEYEPGGVGGCGSEGGCVSLISAGASAPGVAEHESAFLDASASGNDVFFLTAEQLASQDTDGNFDVYDAHVCEAASPCPAAPKNTTPSCDEGSAVPCRGPAPPPPSFARPPSMGVAGVGSSLQRVLGVKEVSKPLTRAQLLAQALKVCKSDKSQSKRRECEKLARERYDPVSRLAQALKACKKDTSRSKRIACEALARKRYGATKKSGGMT
jgi:hypothetical protein